MILYVSELKTRLQMKAIWLVALLWPISGGLLAQQTLRLEDCIEWSSAHSPLAEQLRLYNANYNTQVSVLKKSNLPQLEVNGQASWQSEVTSISLPDNLPFNFNITPPPQDQYRLTLDARQSLWDGGLNKAQRDVQEAQYMTERYQNQVDQYQLSDRVQQLYFGVLLADEQIKITQILIEDLSARIAKMQGLVNEGAALASALRTLQAEFIKAEQRVTELKASRLAGVRSLALFTGKPLSDEVVLERPDRSSPAGLRVRPEAELFIAQQHLTDVRSQLLSARNRPKVSLFATAGYGRPGLNFLANSFEPYFIGGVAFKWPLADVLTGKTSQERQLITIQKEQIRAQWGLFTQNQGIQLARQQAELDKYDALLAQDEAIIALRAQNKAVATAQLDLGVITAHDYTTELNAEIQAREQKALHELQQIQAHWYYWWISGNSR